MGIEHYLVCHKCKEYVDLHKSYEFGMILRTDRPPVGVDCQETHFNDVFLRGGYWESRGLWFIWHHKDHGSELKMWTDDEEEWFDIEPSLIEKFAYNDDLKIRDRVANTKGQK
jgi:hypothetical protein